LKYLIELFNKIWVKVVVEIILIALMWILWYIAKNLVPKKYRLKEVNFKEFLKTFSVILTNSPKNEDGLGVTMTKSKILFEHFISKDVETVLTCEKEMKKYLRDEEKEYSEHKDYGFMHLVFPQIEHFATSSVLQKLTEQEVLVKYTFNINDEEIEVFTARSNSTSYDSFSYHKFFACTKDYNYLELTNLLFRLVNDKLYLSASVSERLIVEKLDMQFSQDNYIVDEILYENLKNEITSFKNKGIQRSYILNGLPGTGKTTFALEMSKKISGRILKIDSNTFNNLSTGLVRPIVENLRCDFIIVDDIDRIHSQDLAGFLFMLENIKSFEHKPTLLATVNKIEELDKAAIRPGRFDDIIEFHLPNTKERYDFFKCYLEKLGFTISEENINLLVDATKGMSQAYLKEYCLQYSIENNIEKIIEKIQRRMKYLDVMQHENQNLNTRADLQAVVERYEEQFDE
jgi:hypothetical protein